MKRIALTVVVTFAAGGPAAAQPAAAPAGEVAAIVDASEACAGGLVRDDGSAETGYGWVPSVVEGIYVQEVIATDLPTRIMEKVCACWLRTRVDAEIDFDVVFYAQEDGRPAADPYASVPAQAGAIPSGVTGRFYEVDVSGVVLVPGVSYVGVRWDPSADDFFFVCVDTTPSTALVEGFFIDDRAADWVSISQALDPIFDAHRAMMIRLVARPEADVPVLPGPGLALFVLGLAVAGAVALARSRRRE